MVAVALNVERDPHRTFLVARHDLAGSGVRVNRVVRACVGERWAVAVREHELDRAISGLWECVVAVVVGDRRGGDQAVVRADESHLHAGER